MTVEKVNPLANFSQFKHRKNGPKKKKKGKNVKKNANPLVLASKLH